MRCILIAEDVTQLTFRAHSDGGFMQSSVWFHFFAAQFQGVAHVH